MTRKTPHRIQPGQTPATQEAQTMAEQTSEQLPDNDPGPRKQTRVPFGDHRLKLSFPEPREGFVNYLFNDWPGRIEEAEAAGYTHVLDENKKPIKRPVGVKDGGGALYGYLMEIPKEWYKEDHARGQQNVDEVEAAINGGAISEGEDPQNRYIPEQGISIRHTATGDPDS